jgi:hypothetical protein
MYTNILKLDGNHSCSTSSEEELNNDINSNYLFFPNSKNTDKGTELFVPNFKSSTSTGSELLPKSNTKTTDVKNHLFVPNVNTKSKNDSSRFKNESTLKSKTTIDNNKEDLFLPNLKSKTDSSPRSKNEPKSKTTIEYEEDIFLPKFNTKSESLTKTNTNVIKSKKEINANISNPPYWHYQGRHSDNKHTVIAQNKRGILYFQGKNDENDDDDDEDDVRFKSNIKKINNIQQNYSKVYGNSSNFKGFLDNNLSINAKPSSYNNNSSSQEQSKKKPESKLFQSSETENAFSLLISQKNSNNNNRFENENKYYAIFDSEINQNIFLGKGFHIYIKRITKGLSGKSQKFNELKPYDNQVAALFVERLKQSTRTTYPSDLKVKIMKRGIGDLKIKRYLLEKEKVYKSDANFEDHEIDSIYGNHLALFSFANTNVPYEKFFDKGYPNIFILKVTLPGSNEKSFFPFYIREYNNSQDSSLYYMYESEGKKDTPSVLLLFDYTKPLRLQQIWIFSGPIPKPDVEFDKNLKNLRNRSKFELLNK